MSRLSDRYYDAVFWIARRVPGRAVAAIALLSYFGVGLALPIVFNWDAAWLINANLYGTLFAGSLLLAWFLVQLQARDRRLLLDWTSDLRLLDGQEFEWLVGELFRREGWKVLERGRQDEADGNIDLELKNGTERRLVQCKRWTVQWVGVDEIRKFVGTLTREGLPPSSGIFVTLSTFNRHAVAEAEASGLELVDGGDLGRRLEKVRNSEPCEFCQKPMILDHSVHGWWLRCLTPGCKGKRHLDREPGRAVALLLDQDGS